MPRDTGRGLSNECGFVIQTTDAGRGRFIPGGDPTGPRPRRTPGMVPRLVHLAWLAAAFAAAGAAPPAVASTVIGTPDPGVAPDGFLCDGGCGDAALGVRQLTLGGESIVADE